MVNIQPINTIQTSTNKRILNPKNTGYAALSGMFLTTVSAMVNSKQIRKSHKPLAFITAALTLLHLGITLKHHNEKKNCYLFNK